MRIGTLFLHALSHSSSKWIFRVIEFNAALLAAYTPKSIGLPRTAPVLPAPEVIVMNFGVDLLALRRG
jgi:hypothetical protein